MRIKARAVRAAAVGLFLATAACAPVYNNHGYVPTDQELAQIQIGTERDKVQEILGRPSAEGMLNADAWYYVQGRWKLTGINAPREIDREVVAISFDPGGRVTNIERFGVENGRVVVLSRRVTTTNIQGSSAVKQIFGNIGRLDAADLLQ
ncbi:outer membrane protein assembly factor BamE [Neotabrizicola shimadae]|uniref:Outer membrane protein assembly factor BamE n=1 Tax=Neotabrizicola shimadae TaxID=2807096 RepID=A0A8G1EDQ4_9RHOB|nr:outer membrane protein assembly factor BamE [Neotabrizicola shimadae]QYZ70408.1 outer membrane protein assembly factor BamE [Neotabrizicola shimadae]